MDVPRNLLAALLVLAVVLHLADGLVAAAMFVAFVAAFLFPATVLIARAPHIRDLPHDLRLAAAAALAIVSIAPWYFARKAIGMPLVVDALTCIVLVALAVTRTAQFELRTSRLTLTVPVAFFLAWLGHAVRTGFDVRFHGPVGAAFGNLVSVVSSLRASSMLPLAPIVDGGPLHADWLYFTIPATLADFLGLSMPNANALILANFLVALLLVHTAVIVARGAWNAAIVILAATAPVLIMFGNHALALVLALLAVAMFERWNGERRLGNAILGAISIAGVIVVGMRWPELTFDASFARILVPLFVLPIVRVVRLRPAVAVVLVAIGLTWSVASFVRAGRESIPTGYHDALVWVRDHTRRNAVLVDPASVPEGDVLWPMVVAERRVWLPTRYTQSTVTGGTPREFAQRLREWQANRPPRGDVAVIMRRCEDRSYWWTTAARFGQWSVCVRR